MIFSDETSVQLSAVRGRRRIQRKKSEVYYPYVVTTRWKGFSEFMWWSCFSYDKKGPYHIWEDETPAEKKAMKKDLDAWNEAKEPNDKLIWEATQAIHRLHTTRA